MRLRITFAKTSHMRYTSHLDLHHAWERTIRRAGLPLAYSQGFNPKPKINLAAALPLGITSSCELVEIWLEQLIPLNQVDSLLREVLPPGIEIIQIETCPLNNPKLSPLIKSAEYMVILIDPVIELPQRIDIILSSKTLVRERRGKYYDLRPLIESISILNPNTDGQQRIQMQLAARPGATGRPDEVLLALGISPANSQVKRTRLIFKTE